MLTVVQEVLARLRDGRLKLVVTTELAARGLDFPNLTHVINFELPTDSQHYVHRWGVKFVLLLTLITLALILALITSYIIFLFALTPLIVRAGRCGRAGKPGIVINMATPDTKFVIRRFGKQLGITVKDCELRDGRVFLKDF